VTEHQGLPVDGYRPQTDLKVSWVNQNKQMEEEVLRRLDVLKNNSEIDQRWLAVGRTAIEQGFMAVNRSIFQPARVQLPSDVNNGD
jgi:hypothetical protein